MMNRRRAAAALLILPALARAQQPSDPLAVRLRGGACVVLLRHGQTTPGVGDPEGFQPGVCSTQRNLSEEGRQQSRQLGQWFKTRGLQPRAVRTSAWCRCIDTADLAFGRHETWPALNSFFGSRDAQTAQTAQLRDALRQVPAGQFEVWVTHQINMSAALTGEFAAMGEGLVLDGRGRVAGRSTFL
ncbi:MAG: hypothetical protein JWQ72_2451 [Polaromonas sp.]|nr:hypothetical protein [Polaromonas sp.]